MGSMRGEVAANGAAALAALEKGDFALVICDWNMKPMTGLELLQVIRADERLAALRFIMITGDSDSDRVQQALAAGVDDFIVKPFTREVLHRKVAWIFDPVAA